MPGRLGNSMKNNEKSLNLEDSPFFSPADVEDLRKQPLDGLPNNSGSLEDEIDILGGF